MLQPVVRESYRYKGDPMGECFVICPKCNLEVSLNRSWFDSYNGDAQVHYLCLSEERQKELFE